MCWSETRSLRYVVSRHPYRRRPAGSGPRKLSSRRGTASQAAWLGEVRRVVRLRVPRSRRQGGR